MDRPSVKKSAAGPLVYFIDEVGVGEAEVNRWNLPWLWSLGGLETTRSKYGRQNTPMLLGSFLAGEASWNLQSQSLQCINHYYDWFIRSVYFSDVFFSQISTVQIQNLWSCSCREESGQTCFARATWAHSRDARRKKCATTWGRSFPQDLHLCGNFFISATCKGISWLSVIGWYLGYLGWCCFCGLR